MPSLQGKEILLIDDAADIRLLLKRILGNDGATLTEASTVDEGLAFAGKKAPHLIITDLRMPGRDGFDFLRTRRGIPALFEIPTIVLSGSDDRKSVTEAIALGATDYILKPIRALLLLQKVRKRLRSRLFTSHRFAASNRPAGMATFGVDVLSASETGLRIDGPAKLAPDANIVLSGAILDTLGAQGLMIRTAPLPEPYIAAGRYVSELNFVGIGDEQAKALRKKLEGWK